MNLTDDLPEGMVEAEMYDGTQDIIIDDMSAEDYLKKNMRTKFAGEGKMSMISQLIDNLEKHAKAYETGEQEGKITAISTAKVLRGAIQTIKEQAEKLWASNLHKGWIPVGEELPTEYDCYLVAWRPIGVTKEFMFGHKHFYAILEFYEDDDGGRWSAVENAHGKTYEILAWQPLPEAYEG